MSAGIKHYKQKHKWKYFTCRFLFQLFQAVSHVSGYAIYVEDCSDWTWSGEHGTHSSILSCSKQSFSKTPMSSLIFYRSEGWGCFSLRNNMGPPAMHEFAVCVRCICHIPVIPHSCSPDTSVPVLARIWFK